MSQVVVRKEIFYHLLFSGPWTQLCILTSLGDLFFRWISVSKADFMLRTECQPFLFAPCFSGESVRIWYLLSTYYISATVLVTLHSIATLSLI